MFYTFLQKTRSKFQIIHVSLLKSMNQKWCFKTFRWLEVEEIFGKIKQKVELFIRHIQTFFFFLLK